MNRRDALKLLGSPPLLGFLALPEPEPTDEFERLQAELVEVIKDSGPENIIPSPSVLEDYQAMEAWLWNGAGDSWKKVNGEWVQVSSGGFWESVTATTSRGILYIDSTGHLNASGQLVRWNGNTWEPLPPE